MLLFFLVLLGDFEQGLLLSLEEHFIGLGGLKFELLSHLELLFSHIRRAVHDKHVGPIEEKDRHAAICSQLIAQVLVICRHKYLVFVALAYVRAYALIRVLDASAVRAGQFDGQTRLLQCLSAKLFLSEILQLSHDALGHEKERLVLKNLAQLEFHIDRFSAEVMEEVSVKQHLEWRMELVHQPEEVHILVVLLSSLDSHL